MAGWAPSQGKQGRRLDGMPTQHALDKLGMARRHRRGLFASNL
jgi:hypothetical protein